MVCPATCAASAVSNCDAFAWVAAFDVVFSPGDASLVEPSLSAIQDTPLAIENPAPIALPMAMIGNMKRLPQPGSREAQQKPCQSLLQRRERRRHHEHVLLLQQCAGRTARWPHALGHRLGPNPLPFRRVLI